MGNCLNWSWTFDFLFPNIHAHCHHLLFIFSFHLSYLAIPDSTKFIYPAFPWLPSYLQFLLPSFNACFLPSFLRSFLQCLLPSFPFFLPSFLQCSLHSFPPPSLPSSSSPTPHIYSSLFLLFAPLAPLPFNIFSAINTLFSILSVYSNEPNKGLLKIEKHTTNGNNEKISWTALLKALHSVLQCSAANRWRDSSSYSSTPYSTSPSTSTSYFFLKIHLPLLQPYPTVPFTL